MSVRSEVLTRFREVADEQDKRLATLVDDLPLVESGLDSLCVAIVVARLEDVLGIDPFTTAVRRDLPFPVTLGEFIRFYENATS